MQYFSIGLGILAMLLLLSGIDDLIPLCACLHGVLRQRNANKEAAETVVTGARERRIAIFVPCWHESAVIGNMIRHNLSAIRYRNYDFFLGVYPNDPPTVGVATQLSQEFPNVHMAECPHPGPTSKADCLNWIYDYMQLFEADRQVHFDTIVLHDAEDVIHPQALGVINRERDHYAMVQVPVLPLATGFADVTHGVYCDEFAEYQLIDMPARQFMRSFIPSNGVGTGFAREILTTLAAQNGHSVFDPSNLTEDYEIGVSIHAAGYKQRFVPLAKSEQGLVATREYFPRSLPAAIRQRTRWITGIALQCWERHGWRGSWRTRYWFWRDRKGLISNPLSIVANLLFLAGVLDYLASATVHRPWDFTVQSRLVAALCAITLALQWFRQALRMVCVARIFGWQSAMGVPIRTFHANVMNSIAAFRAAHFYWSSRRRRRSLTWHKTEHAYPGRDSLHAHRRELADVLIGGGFVSEEQMAQARSQLDADSTIDLLLLARQFVDEEALCRAMSLQSGLAAARLDVREVSRRVARELPSHLEKQFNVIPFAVRDGRLLVATPSVPSSAAIAQVGQAANLPVEFQLVTPSTYEKLLQLL